MATGLISQGSYSIPEGKGPNEGSHLVVISAQKVEETVESEEEAPSEEYTGSGEGSEPEPKTGLAQYIVDGNIIPSKYNEETELSADTSQQQVFDFDLTE